MFGEMIQFDEDFVENGCFNHQPEKVDIDM